MRRSAERAARVRFDRTERIAHWTTALLVVVLVASGVILYVPALSLAVGRRLLVEDIHVFTGVAVFAPLGASVLGRSGRQLRRDLAGLGRMTAGERMWLRTLGRSQRASVAKFNPGQKLNAAAVGGLLASLLLTGIVLRWGNVLPVSWRTGATFVHDWFALALAVLLLGHIAMALSHPAALASMVTGKISDDWARRHAPLWVADVELPPLPTHGAVAVADADAAPPPLLRSPKTP